MTTHTDSDPPPDSEADTEPPIVDDDIWPDDGSGLEFEGDTSPPISAPISVSEFRDAALIHLTHACGGDAGRDEFDPVYVGVTEGRDVGAMRKKYSSCGDLAHWLYQQLGIRSSFVNRESQGGWRMGKNVSLLAWSDHARVCSPSSDRYECGDVVIIWSKPSTQDAHVMCVLQHDPAADGQPARLVVAEYGQPGGAIHAHRIVGGKVKRRKLQRVIPLELVLEAAHAAGELEPVAGPEV